MLFTTNLRMRNTVDTSYHSFLPTQQAPLYLARLLMILLYLMEKPGTLVRLVFGEPGGKEVQEILPKLMFTSITMTMGNPEQ